VVEGVDAVVLRGINAHHAGWYADLHMADFPDGAVRGQLFRTGSGSVAAEGFPFAARVLSGDQIYACTAQPGDDRIRGQQDPARRRQHRRAGPTSPQPGRRVACSRTPVEVERLNTVGGVAPPGSCDPATRPIVKVPYQADYLFITS
jgi:hypothetical protein